jgi:hypothetical protein
MALPVHFCNQGIGSSLATPLLEIELGIFPPSPGSDCPNLDRFLGKPHFPFRSLGLEQGLQHLATLG